MIPASTMLGIATNCPMHGLSVHAPTNRCNACGLKLGSSPTASATATATAVHSATSTTSLTFSWACNIEIGPRPYVIEPEPDPELTEREILLERARVAYRALLQMRRPERWRRHAAPRQAPRARLEPPARRRARHESIGLRNYAPRRNP